MISPERIAQEWIARGWPMLLAFTLGLVIVFALRKSCRRLFGAERSFQLWLLPLLAWVVTQLPNSRPGHIIELPPVVQKVASVSATLNTHVVEQGTNPHLWLLLAWLAGVVLTLVRAALAQRRYRNLMRDAVSIGQASDRWPLVRANSVDIGPAMVGAWRPCIVLPADFEARYDATERMLILAHESMHARRLDGCWSLLAQMLVSLFWFHPLAWLGWSAFRHDQELACDAAVVREHHAQRRSYANAMLKTQTATALLPIGCNWSPRHPLTERIAMLTRKTPSPRRRAVGALLLLSLTFGIAGFSYAASRQSALAVKAPVEYRLAIVVSRGNHTLASPTVCTRENEPATILQQSKVDGEAAWQFKFVLKPAGSDQVQMDIHGSVDEAGQHDTVAPTLRGPLGKVMLVSIGGHASPLQLSITPSTGCSAESPSS
ncbi:M56 family metallopeptidase [Dyella nitratireducens]|uniref:Peptidase M56 domain-containing protein n=1 Tax=Dyella nitratireducens TaxID=1849580 RepID=A0ABQ1G118_9GAMM|nr:M56 family metallopeptidase [Dyella nitratireducens]GGA34979.1 hypothetical protein GCM10010981_25040 [Dyella nitratireducens]GLQ40939.1 hypothetical protein GCM10007902_07890 [Dyella nitratireducens]